jgi:hypothetical protein
MSDVSLPAYSGPYGTCPKCGVGWDCTTRYHAQAAYGASWACGAIPTPGPPEHLCRECKNCGHKWMEATIPSPSEPTP